MTKARDIADLGSNDVLDTTASGVSVTGSITADALTVETAAGATVTVKDTGRGGLQLAQTGGGSGIINVADANEALILQTNSTNRMNVASNGDITMYKDDGTTAGMTFDASSGNVGIGTAPGRALHVKSSNATVMQVESTNASIAQMTFVSDGAASNPAIGAIDDTAFNIQTGNVERLRIQSDGSVQFKPDGTNVDMTLDASGNLLVGKTVEGVGNIGFQARPDGFFSGTRNGGTVSYLQRQTSDGEILRLQKDNSTVGSVGTNGGRPYFVNPTYGGLKVGTGYSVDPANNSTGAGWDNALDLGAGGTRWKDGYFSGQVGVGGTTSSGRFGSGITVRRSVPEVHLKRDDSNGEGGLLLDNASSTQRLFVGTYNANQETHIGTNGTQRIVVDASGRVTTPSQPSFTAHLTANQSVTAYVDNTLTGWTCPSHGNVGSHFNTSNGRFTAPVTGYYLFTGAIQTNTQSSLHIAFNMNGSAYESDSWIDHGNSTLGAELTRIMYLTTNQYVTLIMLPTINQLANANRTRFQGYLLG